MFVDHLERRRGELATAMWQAPGLTIAAQAFLLIVLTNASIPACARWVVLAAGVTATASSVFTLLRLRQREVLYSDAIVGASKDWLGMADPRPDRLEHLRVGLGREGKAADLDGWIQRQAAREWPGLHLLWIVTLALFIVADFAALLATD